MREMLNPAPERRPSARKLLQRLPPQESVYIYMCQYEYVSLYIHIVIYLETPVFTLNPKCLTRRPSDDLQQESYFKGYCLRWVYSHLSRCSCIYV